MSLTSVQWIEASLSLSLVGIFSFFIVISSLNTEAQPESINVQNTIVTAPLTVVVPITVDAQNAQICVSAASSGDQSCTQEGGTTTQEPTTEGSTSEGGSQ